MSISLILIGIISLIVIGGTAYLYSNQNEELTDKKKTTILLIVGTVIFLSFLVTTFKHRDLGFRSATQDQGSLNVQQVFYGDKCHYAFKPKYQNLFKINRKNVLEMYRRNYLSLYDLQEKNDEQLSFMNDYQQLILFLSKKDEGASFFLNDLAKQICHQKSTPVIYLKLDREIRNEADFLKRVGVHSFGQLQTNLCYFSKVDIRVNRYDVEYHPKYTSEHVFPYLIIDNFDYLLSALADPQVRHSFEQQMEQSEQKYHSDQDIHHRDSKYSGRKRLFDKILKELVGNCRANLILNTEKEEAIEQLYELWEENEEILRTINRGTSGRPFPFEFHRWEGLKQYDLFKIISNYFPKSDFHLSKIVDENKQGKYSFKDLFLIMQEMKLRTEKASIESQHQSTKESMFIKEWDIKYNLARYYGLNHEYKTIKATENRKISSIKNKVSYESLMRLEDLGLIEIRAGFVSLK